MQAGEARARELEAQLTQQAEATAAAKRRAEEVRREGEAALEAQREKAKQDREGLLRELDERLRRVAARETQLSAAVAKVMNAEEAMEACLTCMSCMSLLKDPSTCVPCGHTFCSGCLTAAGGNCQECGDEGTGFQQTVKVQQLETLVSKFGFQRQALAALATTNATAA